MADKPTAKKSSTKKKVASKKVAGKAVVKKTTKKVVKKSAKKGTTKKAVIAKKSTRTKKPSSPASKKISKKVSLRIPVKKVISPDQYFWINHGPIVKDVDDLVEALDEITDDQFLHHTRREPGANDFVNWIEKVMEDRLLAQRLARAQTRSGARRIILTYVSGRR